MQFLNPGQLSLILYDHNKPALDLYPFKQYVSEIVDHHADETSQVYEKGQLKSSDIKLIGSATSIVSQYFMDQGEIGKQILKNSPVIIESFYSCILLDTYNFSPSMKGSRWTEQDEEAFSYLASLFENSPNQQDIAKTLQDLKFNVEMNKNLGVIALLKKDYKSFEYSFGKVGYSAITVKPNQFFEIIDFQKQLMLYSEEQSLSGIFLLFVYPNQKNNSVFEREFVLISKNESIIAKVNELFQKLNFEKRHYSEVEQEFPKQNLTIYDPTASYSRKLLEPLISQINISN